MGNQQNRILWADQAKALAIFLMVLGHYGLSSESAIQVIGIFHMPIFFLISGYFDKGQPFSKELLLKTCKTIMVPYFFFSICAFSICWVSPYLHPELYNNDGMLKTFQKAFVGMFLMEDRVRSYAFMPLGPLWFLAALFEVKIIIASFFYVCNRINKIVGIIILVTLFLLCYNIQIRYFSLDAAIMAIPIYLIGYEIKKYNVIERITKRWMSVMFFVLGLLYLCFIGPLNGKVGMDGANYGNCALMFYVNALVGSLTFIFMFKGLNVKWSWLSVIGAATLTILGTHFYIGILGRTLGVILLSIDPANEPSWFVVPLSIVGIAFGVGCHKFIMKYIPFVLGKNK